MTLQFKIENNPDLNDLNFYLIFLLKDYFLDIDELFLVNEFYKYFDLNNDGCVDFSEIENILKSDNYNDDEVKNYIYLLKSILSCNFRLNQIENHHYEIIEYDFFLVANIILNIFRNETNKIVEKIRIMFSEIDDDENGKISVDEITSRFKLKYYTSNQQLIQTFNKIRGNIFYPSDPNKQIKDFMNMDNDDFKKMIFYDCVDLSPNQIRKIKSIEKNGKTSLNDSNKKSNKNLKHEM